MAKDDEQSKYADSKPREYRHLVSKIEAAEFELTDSIQSMNSQTEPWSPISIGRRVSSRVSTLKMRIV